MSYVFVFPNNVQTTLSAPVAAGDITINLASSTNLPALTTGQAFPITLNDAATGQIYEVCYCTGVTGSQLTVVRGQEGTSAQAWSVGDNAFSDATSETLGTFVTEAADNSFTGTNTFSGSVNLPGANSSVSWFTTGDVKFTIKNVADTGWIMCDDGTIGDASSGGTTRANADTQTLFELLWNNVSDAYAPVSGGRGTSASADFAANKTITLTQMLGRSLAVAGSGSGLSARALGETVGEETHLLTVAEVPQTTTTLPLGTSTGGGQNDLLQASANTGTQDYSNNGGGGSHNNMQPTSFLNAMIKL